MTAREAGAVAWPRPRLVVSACLELKACRFNGQKIRARFLPRLARHVDLLPVCPEVEIGLGVPRPAVRLVAIDGAIRMVQPATDADLTERMTDFAGEFLGALGAVDGFLLKSRSPSCGPKDVRVYGPKGIPVDERSGGLFAEAVRERYPLAALEDEGRLTNYQLRHHFLTRLFQLARLRTLPATMADLVRFHTGSKLLLLACSETGLRSLGRIVANRAGLPPAAVKRLYTEEFARALASAPKPGPVVNALTHAFGHLSDDLLPDEKRVFLSTLVAYRERRTTLEAPLALIRGWNARYGSRWVGEQSLFLPFPAELHDLDDSAGRIRAA